MYVLVCVDVLFECVYACAYVRAYACLYVCVHVCIGPYVCLGEFDIVLANQGVICLGLGVRPTFLHNSTLC